MNSLIEKLLAPLSKANRCLMAMLSFITVTVLAALTLDVLLGVVTRYIWGSQAGFTDELARMLLIWLSFFGGALAFGKKAHIGLTLISDKMAFPARKYCEAAAAFVSLIFVVSVWLCGGVFLLQTSMDSANKLATMPLQWWQIYICVPLSGIFAAAFLAEITLSKLIERDGE